MAKHPGSSIERSPQNRRISGAENETRYTSAERDHERIAFALCPANPPVLQARLSVEDWHRISKVSRILVLKLDEYDHEVEGFTEYLNSRDPNIKLTMEPVSDGKLAFLDICVHIKDDGSTKVTMYRKPTYTNHYPDLDSSHHLGHKRSIVGTLFHPADTVISEGEDTDRTHEIEHLEGGLRDNNYEAWMCKIPQKHWTPSVPLPHVQSVSEKISRAFRKANMYFDSFMLDFAPRKPYLLPLFFYLFIFFFWHAMWLNCTKFC